jgi:hypothetical protein
VRLPVVLVPVQQWAAVLIAQGGMQGAALGGLKL